MSDVATVESIWQRVCAPCKLLLRGRLCKRDARLGLPLIVKTLAQRIARCDRRGPARSGRQAV